MREICKYGVVCVVCVMSQNCKFHLSDFHSTMGGSAGPATRRSPLYILLILDTTLTPESAQIPSVLEVLGGGFDVVGMLISGGQDALESRDAL